MTGWFVMLTGPATYRFVVPVLLALLSAGDRVSAAGGVDVGGYDPTRPDIPAEVLFRQRTFRRADGLPSDRVLALKITKDRALWIGTDAGLARYTGDGFRVFDHVSHPEFVNDTVRAIDEGPDGSLWVGTGAGLLQMREGRAARRYTTADGLADDEIVNVRARRNGEIWFGTRTALHRLKAGMVSSWRGFWDLHRQTHDLRSMVEDDEGVLLLAGAGTLLKRWDDRSQDFKPLPMPNAPEGILGGNGLVLGSRGDVWFLQLDGFRRRAGVWEQLPESNRRTTLWGRPIMEDRHGNLWLTGWDDGVRVWRDGRLRQFDTKDGLGVIPVQTIAEDHEGALWLGGESGLARWLPRRVAALAEADGLPSLDVWTFAEAADGTLWIGTDDGVCRRSPDGHVDRPVQELRSRRVRSLHVARDGTLWIGTGDSLESWRDGRLIAHRWEQEPSMNKVRVVTSDPAGRIWVGRQRGLMRFDGSSWQRFTATNGLPDDDVRALRLDRTGRLWIGTFGGGLVLAEVGFEASEPRIIARLSSTNGLLCNSVWAFHETDDGRMWAGTERGLVRISTEMDDTEVRVDGRIGRLQGLHYEIINEILEDDRGFFWLGTDRGIVRLRRSEAEAVVEGRAKTVTTIVLGEADGLMSAESNGQKSQPAGLKARDGSIWFPTTRGALRLAPQDVTNLLSPPVVVGERVVADGQVLLAWGPGGGMDDAQVLRALAGGVRVLEVGFDAVSFREPRDLRFRHRLLGFETNWVEAADRRVAYYTNLDPGRYRFEVQAAVNHGLWGPVATTLELELPPRWYQTLGVQVGSAAAVVALAAVLLRRRERQRAHLASLERAVEIALERQRIARDMHDDLGAGLTRLVLLGDRARRDSPAAPSQVAPFLERVGGEAARLVEQLGELVWATNPDYDDLGALLGRLREYAASYLADAGLEADLQFPENTPLAEVRVSGAIRKGLSLAFKEAITNAVRHSGARRVEVVTRVDAGWLEVAVGDDGRGFEEGTKPVAVRGDSGHGLQNMRVRLERIGGTCSTRSEPGVGTKVVLRVPLTDR